MSPPNGKRRPSGGAASRSVSWPAKQATIDRVSAGCVAPGELLAVGPGYEWRAYGLHDNTVCAALYLVGRGLVRHDIGRGLIGDDDRWWYCGANEQRVELDKTDLFVVAYGTEPHGWPILAEQAPLCSGSHATDYWRRRRNNVSSTALAPARPHSKQWGA